MKKCLTLAAAGLLFAYTYSYGQSYAAFETAPGLRFPADTAAARSLLQHLDSFLKHVDMPPERNAYILPEELDATAVLIDEMKLLEQQEQTGVAHYYKARLTNISRLPGNCYQLQLAYMNGKSDTPFLKASVRLMAAGTKEGFRFYAPLRRQCRNWPRRTEGDVTFIYRDRIDTLKMAYYSYYDKFFGQKFGAPRHTEFYCCPDLPEAMQLIGIDNQSDYNGITYGTVSAHTGNRSIIVNGSLRTDFSNFDPHDMWHAKLRQYVPPGQVNKAVDEGCAFLYAGSWGMSWEMITDSFRAYSRLHPRADWLQLYMDGTNFKDGDQALKISYYLNALIIRKLEKEKGFHAVKDLLTCGPYEKSHDNYFRSLERIAGIRRQDFNKKMNELVKLL